MGALALALSAADLRTLSGEPRVHDLRIGEVLGFTTPKNVRKVIRRHQRELLTHGVLPQSDSKPPLGSTGGRPEKPFYLNEAQALLVCMFARTNEAIAARKQIIDVFLAWRHGRLKPVRRNSPANDRDLPWAKMEQRLKRLERLMEVQAKLETAAFAGAIAYSPAILYLQRSDGRRKKQSRPRWWPDREVREALITYHRQTTLDIAVESIAAEFGRHRAPSRSSLGRFWKVLDEVRAAS